MQHTCALERAILPLPAIRAFCPPRADRLGRHALDLMRTAWTPDSWVLVKNAIPSVSRGDSLPIVENRHKNPLDNKPGKQLQRHRTPCTRVHKRRSNHEP